MAMAELYRTMIGTPGGPGAPANTPQQIRASVEPRIATLSNNLCWWEGLDNQTSSSHSASRTPANAVSEEGVSG